MLTDTKTRTIREPGKYFDGGGLYLEVNDKGAKYWRLKYRIHGKERRLAFGVYPVVGLKEARERRELAKKLIADGIDPNQHRREQERKADEAQLHTFKAVARDWCNHMYGTWKPRHAATVLKYFERDVFPTIGACPISEIMPLDLKRVVKEIEKRGALDIAKRIAFRIGAVFKYARLHGYIDKNPAEALSSLVKTRKTTHYPALTEADLPDFLRRLQEFRGYKLTQLAVRLALLTVVRSGELRAARWEEFDVNAKLWRIPAERMKVGELHLVPLSRQALATVKEINALTGDRLLLFPNRNRPDQPFSENTVNRALADLGYKGKATGHGFRSTFSTILNERGINRDWIERQLAHSERDEVRAAYNAAQYLDQRRVMMQVWADLLDSKAAHRAA